MGCREERRRENYTPDPKDRDLNSLRSSITLSVLEMLLQISTEGTNNSAGEKWAKVFLYALRVNRTVTASVI